MSISTGPVNHDGNDRGRQAVSTKAVVGNVDGVRLPLGHFKSQILGLITKTARQVFIESSTVKDPVGSWTPTALIPSFIIVTVSILPQSYSFFIQTLSVVTEMLEDNAALLSVEPEDEPQPKIYDSVRSDDGGPFNPGRSFLGVLPKMILLTFLGFVTAISHHLVYQHMDGQPVRKQYNIGKIYLDPQQVFNAFGNVLALTVNISFKTAVCFLFVQQFWFHIRRRSFSGRDIDALIGMQYSVLPLSAWRVVPSTILTIALIIFCMPLVSVLPPGALTVVQGNFNHKQNCNVSTTQYMNSSTLLGIDDTGGGNMSVGASLPLIQKLAAKVLLLGSYIPPPTPCGACEYNISYAAPAVQCSRIVTSLHRRQIPVQTDIKVAGPFPKLLPDNTTTSAANTTPNPTSSSVPENPQPTDAIYIPNPVPLKYLVWNATYSFTQTFNLQITWDSGGFVPSNSTLTGPASTIQCTASNATYYGYVTHNASLATMEVTSVMIHNPLEFPGDSSAEMWSMVAIADALATQIQGVVWLHTAGDIAPGSSLVAYGIGGTTTLNGVSWDWKTDPLLAIPSLMQNISLSMLADNIGALPNYSTLTNTEQECRVSTLIFHYDPLRLAGTYISATLVTLACLALGFWTIHMNGTDESVTFVRWMDAVVHQDILDRVKIGELTQDTPLQARRSDGRLVVSGFGEEKIGYPD